jgi:glutamyl-tRNA reductase
MSIVLVGLNHHTAPVELREQLALTDCGLQMALGDLQLIGQRCARPILHEAAILSTCNRLEIYGVAQGNAADAWNSIEDFLSSLQDIERHDLHPHLYFRSDQEAIRHLLRVAAGLDSAILGEPQILGQVAQAFADARAAGVTGAILAHLFTLAVRAGKRARTETEISRHTSSISHAAAQLAKDKFGDLKGANVLIVGAGEMAALAAQALQRHGARQFTVINRTYLRAETLAAPLNGRALNWYHLDKALAWADVVITATGAPHTVIYASDVAQMLSERQDRKLLFIDIAVPRDVEEAVDNLPGTYRYDIDDLEASLDANLAYRQAAVPAVEAIVEAESANFLDWLHCRQVVPVIAELQRKAEAVVESEVTLALRKLKGLTAHDQEVVERLAHRIVGKLLHDPTIRLKALAACGNGYGYAHAVRELFALETVQQQRDEFPATVCSLQCILPAINEVMEP